jgi:Nif-specific regulatory protein
MSDGRPTTGVPAIDRLIGGVLPGDNLVWEVDSAAPVDRFVLSFLAACEAQQSPVVYVSFNRSPQTVASTYAGPMSAGRFTLVDCFSSGKGENDEAFLDFFQSGNQGSCRAVQAENPADPEKLHEQLTSIAAETGSSGRYVFDSLTGMLDLWREEDVVLRFFGHLCPRLYDLNTVAYWLLEKDAHSEPFLAKLRHITQVVLEVAVAQGIRTLTVRKAVNRHCSEIGVPQQFDLEGGRLVMSPESREDRELGLLTRMGEAVGTALDPSLFFEQTMQLLAKDLGMIRGTIVLLDRTTRKLRIAAAHGLTPQERARGEYAIGEGVTGHVVQTGLPAVVPDISQDPRFLDRTAGRRTDSARPIAFICVPLKVDDQVVGVLSVDRPVAVQASLDKDLRLLTIVASTVSQVLKINRLISVEKEKVLAHDEELLRELRSRYRLDNVVGQSQAIQQVLATAATAAKSRASILVTGETGTGKELVASVIHYNSRRASGPFVKVNCGALPETLLESELFGHVKGAFTGAVESRKGRFELADGGTLFLDEVAEMSPRLQVKLLRVLQEREFEPVGGTRTIHVDVRVVAATNKDLSREIREGRFREDLYYRLNVIPIQLPSLRERRQDIPLLVNHFLEKYNRENDKNVSKISPGVLDRLLEYPWPGNVRELENCIERVVVLSPGEVFLEGLLPPEVARQHRNHTCQSHRAWSEDAFLRQAAEALGESATNLSEVRDRLLRVVEETLIRKALESGSNQRELAERLGMSRMTLRKKIRQYGIT